MRYYIEFWKRAFDFKGVASRKQYWLAVLFNFIMLLVLSLIFMGFQEVSYNAGNIDAGYEAENGLNMVTSIYSLLMLIPSISISVRRLHDHNRSGWMYLISLIPVIGSIIIFIFMLLGTVKVNNRWRMYDIQRGYIREDIFDEPLSNNQWTYK